MIVDCRFDNHQSTIDNHQTQTRITCTRRRISSAGISSPWPDPGQTSQVRCQCSGEATVLSQRYTDLRNKVWLTVREEVLKSA